MNCTKPAKGSATTDPNGHGTHVGGTVAALDNGIDVVGVAPGARLWSVRVASKHGYIPTASLLCGIEWVTATRTDSDPGNDIEVANLSLGGNGTDDGDCGRSNRDAVHLAICASVAVGVTYVVSAGNQSHDLARQTPAAYDEVLTVTAMTDVDGLPGGTGQPTGLCASMIDAFEEPAPDDAAAFFSNFATVPSDFAHTVAAPGVCIPSTYPDNQVFLDVGTSMATPHAAGTVALCIASGACSGLTPAQIVEKVVADAAAYNAANPGYGFAGDPLRPVSGEYYGYLISSGLY